MDEDEGKDLQDDSENVRLRAWLFVGDFRNISPNEGLKIHIPLTKYKRMNAICQSVTQHFYFIYHKILYLSGRHVSTL